MKASTKGFTLIELLVVISILGVLSTMIMSSINEARYNAQITKTVRDLQTIEQAFQMMIISENMNCWPRERTADTPGCSFAAATGGHLAPSPFNNGQPTGPTVARILEDQTINLHHYLGASPKHPFPTIGEGYRYDNEQNIITGCATSHQGVNIVFHMNDTSLATKIYNSLREKFPTDVFGCPKVRLTTHGSNGRTIYYSLAAQFNKINF